MMVLSTLINTRPSNWTRSFPSFLGPERIVQYSTYNSSTRSMLLLFPRSTTYQLLSVPERCCRLFAFLLPAGDAWFSWIRFHSFSISVCSLARSANILLFLIIDDDLPHRHYWKVEVMQSIDSKKKTRLNGYLLLNRKSVGNPDLTSNCNSLAFTFCTAVLLFFVCQGLL